MNIAHKTTLSFKPLKGFWVGCFETGGSPNSRTTQTMARGACDTRRSVPTIELLHNCVARRRHGGQGDAKTSTAGGVSIEGCLVLGHGCVMEMATLHECCMSLCFGRGSEELIGVNWRDRSHEPLRLSGSMSGVARRTRKRPMHCCRWRSLSRCPVVDASRCLITVICCNQ